VAGFLPFASPRSSGEGAAATTRSRRGIIPACDPAGNGKERSGHHALAEPRFQVFGGKLAALEVLVHERLVALGDVLGHGLAVLPGLVGHVGGDLAGLHLPPGLVEGQGLHLHEVDHALERVLGADGDEQGGRLLADDLAHALDSAGEIGPFPVHFVDEQEPGQAVLVGGLPDLLGLELDAAHGIDDDEGRVSHAEAAARVHGEIGVAGGVQQVDPVPVPVDEGSRGADGDAALLFLGLPVHGGRAVVDAPQAVRLSGHEEHGFGDRRLPGAAVSDDRDIAKGFRIVLCHRSSFPAGARQSISAPFSATGILKSRQF